MDRFRPPHSPPNLVGLECFLWFGRLNSFGLGVLSVFLKASARPNGHHFEFSIVADFTRIVRLCGGRASFSITSRGFRERSPLTTFRIALNLMHVAPPVDLE